MMEVGLDIEKKMIYLLMSKDFTLKLALNVQSQQTVVSFTHETLMLRHIIKPNFIFYSYRTSSRRSQCMCKLRSDCNIISFTFYLFKYI